MPLSINGFGTAFYGAREFRPDGSYVTTEWIIAAGLPILPLKSQRLLPQPKDDVDVFVYRNEGYWTVEKIPLHRRQVLHVYTFLAVSALWLYLVGSNVEHFGNTLKTRWAGWEVIAVVVGIALAFLPPFFAFRWLERRAQNSTTFSKEAFAETMHRLVKNSPQAPSPASRGPALPPPLPIRKDN